MFKLNFLNFGLCPFPLVLSLGITDKSLALSSLLPLIRYLYTLIRCALYPQPFLLQAKPIPALPACLLMSDTPNPYHLHGPLLDLLQYLHACLTQRSRCGLVRAEPCGIITFINLLEMLFLVQQGAAGCLSCKGDSLAHFPLVNQDLQVRFCKASL